MRRKCGKPMPAARRWLRLGAGAQTERSRTGRIRHIMHTRLVRQPKPQGSRSKLEALRRQGSNGFARLASSSWLRGGNAPMVGTAIVSGTAVVFEINYFQEKGILSAELAHELRTGFRAARRACRNEESSVLNSEGVTPRKALIAACVTYTHLETLQGPHRPSGGRCAIQCIFHPLRHGARHVA